MNFLRLNQVVIVLHLTLLTHAFSSVVIKCTYEYQEWGWQSIGKIYECECKKSIKVSERNTVVSNVTGMHASNANNSNVQGIHIIGASYLPKGVEKFFPNLVGLSMEQHLEEITKTDLEPFPNLKHVWLARNQLIAIEEDLFKYNPKLVYISLRQNFIKQIDSNVFDHLGQLTILELDRNECIHGSAVGRYAVQQLIEQTKEQCTVDETLQNAALSKMEIEIRPEELILEQNVLIEKMSFWKNLSIVLLSIMVFVAIVVLGVLYRNHGGYGVAKFVSFRNS